jgi:hypothetical protein
MDFINSLTVGEAVAIFVALESVIQAVSIYFNKFYNIKKKQEDETEHIEENTKSIKQHSEQIELILETIKIDFRRTIVSGCLAALKEGEIETEDLQSLLDLYEIYEKLGGNSYAESLIKKVKKLKVV